MNSLSWMIYLAGVSQGVSAVLMLTGIIGVIISLIAAVVAAVVASDGDDVTMLTGVLKWCAPCAFGAFFVAAILPSQTTVYAIAASEMGEKALATPTAGKAMKALDAWLDKQIAETPTDKR